MNILQAIDDSKVFGQHFRAGSWQAWRVFLAALFALPLTDAELAIYRQCTGRDGPPSAPLYESWLVCGRRAGKSFILATVAVFLACFFDWRPYLGPGEIATIMIIARDRRQGEVFRKHGVEYSVADKAKNDLYRDLLPLLNSGRVELLDLPRLVAQLCSLERRTARGGRDSIDHPPGAHDDVANCVAGVAVTAVQAPAVPVVGPLLFNFRTGEIIPTASQANCLPPAGFNRRSCDEPWFPYVGASGVRRDRWSPDW